MGKSRSRLFNSLAGRTFTIPEHAVSRKWGNIFVVAGERKRRRRRKKSEKQGERAADLLGVEGGEAREGEGNPLALHHAQQKPQQSTTLPRASHNLHHSGAMPGEPAPRPNCVFPAPDRRSRSPDPRSSPDPITFGHPNEPYYDLSYASIPLLIPPLQLRES